MKAREQIYKSKGAGLFRLITTYHTLQYEQVMRFFSQKEESIRTLITNLVKTGTYLS